jgi:hypothetical protein
VVKGVFFYLAERADQGRLINGKNLTEPNSRRDYIPSNFPEKNL